MRRLLPILSAMLIAVFIAQHSYASHSRGSYITYINVSPNIYLVEFTYLVDCGAIGAGPTQTLNYMASGCNSGGTLTLNKQSTSVAGPFCPSVITACTTPGAVYDQEIVKYSGLLTLPDNCDNWLLNVRVDIRGTAHTVNGQSVLYSEATINNQHVANNSSPLITNFPFIYVNPAAQVLNGTYTYNLGVIDVDGDSLAYSLQPSKNDVNQLNSYKAGFSATAPFGTNNGSISLDSVTGTVHIEAPNYVTGPPTGGGNAYIWVVQVDEFRKDTAGVYHRIGQIRRDAFLEVFDGAQQNHLPALQPIIINGKAKNFDSVVEVEAGQPVTIQFTASDGDLSDQLSLSTNAEAYFQNASLNSTGSAASPNATLTLTPTLAQVRDYPYYITFTVKDNACPLVGFQTQTIGLRVKSPGSVSGIKEDLAKKYQLPTLLNTNLNERLQLHSELTGATVNIYNHTGSLVKSISNYNNSWNANSVAAGLYIYSVEHTGLAQPITSKLLIVK